ncbi:hypothetical protein H5410_034212 [Solanum commersonii]|uniref:Uncharacterized protein n=1 Tax=Solanum commersonii TaxID=4109 RepID=A0A9J5YQZ0_SOLCO|nr:hypothetical protein H5410_034212 [Solanum commersonii]
MVAMDIPIIAGKEHDNLDGCSRRFGLLNLLLFFDLFFIRVADSCWEIVKFILDGSTALFGWWMTELWTKPGEHNQSNSIRHRLDRNKKIKRNPLLKPNHTNVMEVPGSCKIIVVPKTTPSIKNGQSQRSYRPASRGRTTTVLALSAPEVY